jgi:hypothetical protein
VVHGYEYPRKPVTKAKKNHMRCKTRVELSLNTGNTSAELCGAYTEHLAYNKCPLAEGKKWF